MREFPCDCGREVFEGVDFLADDALGAAGATCDELFDSSVALAGAADEGDICELGSLVGSLYMQCEEEEKGSCFVDIRVLTYTFHGACGKACAGCLCCGIADELGVDDTANAEREEGDGVDCIHFY